MILSFCDNPDVLKVMRIIDIVVTIIKVSGPIILIVSCMLDYMNAVKDNDNDALQKANKIIVKRIIAAMLIFMIPTFVKLIANITSNTVSYSGCIANATSEGISAAYKNMSQKYIDIAKNTLTDGDYRTAIDYINRNIKDENTKMNLQSELDNVKNYLDIRDKINKLKSKYNETEYKKVQEEISKISDSNLKSKLEAEFKKVIRPIEGNPNGSHEKSTVMTYVVHAPKTVNPGMPLILYLHGDGGGNSNGSSPFLSAAKKYFGDNLPFILVTPNGGMWAETNGRLSELKSIIDKECEKYKCDKTKIGISGHSRGSIGTWHMINSYPKFFYSAVPVSCGSYSINYNNFVGTKIRAYAGTSGDAEAGYNSAMRANVRRIKNAGGDATFISLPGATHGSAPGQAFTKDTLLWMIS